MTNYNQSDFWFNDLGVLVDPDKMGEVFPYHNMTYPQKMNSLVRLSILLGLTLCLIYQRIKYIYIPLIVMGGTFVLYLLKVVNKESDLKVGDVVNYHLGNQNKKEEFSSEAQLKEVLKPPEVETCFQPTPENPFANVIGQDKRVELCPVNHNPELMEKYFNRNLFRNASDIWNKEHGQRQFFTMPKHDTISHAKFLYSRKPTCKEGNGNQCFVNKETLIPRKNAMLSRV
tara:strand:- start:2181 stop:2867 length:687 start_codon:yes stop_codon:yes gene_type:complete